MATKKTAVKKKSVKKQATTPKKAVPKKAAAKKKTAPRKKAAPPKKAVKRALRGAVPLSTTSIQSCGVGTGRRCKRKANGGFVCQQFTNGKWEQVAGTTVLPSMEACLAACCG